MVHHIPLDLCTHLFECDRGKIFREEIENKRGVAFAKFISWPESHPFSRLCLGGLITARGGCTRTWGRFRRLSHYGPFFLRASSWH